MIDSQSDIYKPSLLHTALARGLCFMVLWSILLPSMKLADLVVGMLAVVSATCLSLQLLSRQAGHLNLRGLLAFAPHFLWQSVLAGMDVARRALKPRMVLHPGFVVFPVGFHPGLARNEFASITSLMPGSVPIDETEQAIIYHTLDISRPFVQQMAEEERLLKTALIAGDRYD